MEHMYLFYSQITLLDEDVKKTVEEDGEVKKTVERDEDEKKSEYYSYSHLII